MGKSEIYNNINNTRESIKSSRYRQKGETTKNTKLSSKNFDKLMKQRGLSKEDRSSLKNSFDRSQPMQVRHGQKGEKFTVTHGTQSSSGVFVSEKSLGKTPGQRIDKGALPNCNSAKYETRVVLDKNQNLIYGKIASQPKFQKLDQKQQPRKGGGTQVITDGGYKSGAIRNSDTKYPVPTNTRNDSPAQRFRKCVEKSNIDAKNSNEKVKSKGNKR